MRTERFDREYAKVFSAYWFFNDCLVNEVICYVRRHVLGLVIPFLFLEALLIQSCQLLNVTRTHF